jgi:hypothetical protein
MCGQKAEGKVKKNREHSNKILKSEAFPGTVLENPEGQYKYKYKQNYSSIPPLNSTLDGVGGQRHAPAALLNV